MVEHSIPPIYNEQSSILILGSFPSVKSREQGFFYGHPQNRFWKVLSCLYGEKTPQTIDEKRWFLMNKGIAVWDVIASCEINGSMDSTIKNVIPNDLSLILETGHIRHIFVNGQTAKKLYDQYIFPKTAIEAVALPSTSSANAAWNFERLTEAWKIILE